MNHTELRQARESLGLTVNEAAEVLDTNPKSVRRWESAPENQMARAAPARVERLLKAYLEGYRPDDWPERLVRRAERLAEIEEVRTK